MPKFKNPGHYLLASVVVFAGANALVKYLDHISSFEHVFFRALISLFFAFTYLKWKKINIWGNNKRLLLARGFFGTIALTLYFYTLQQMPLATAVTIQYLSPFFAIWFSKVWLKETVYRRQWLFLALAFVGVLVVKGFDPRVSTFDAVCGVFAAGFSGMAFTIISRLKDSDGPMVVVFYFPLVTLPLITPFVVYHWVTPQGMDWLILVSIGLLMTVGQVLLTLGYQGGKMGAVAIYRYFGAIFALLMGYFIFDETMSWQSLGGMLLIVIAVVLSGRFQRQLRQADEAKAASSS